MRKREPELGPNWRIVGVGLFAFLVVGECLYSVIFDYIGIHPIVCVLSIHRR